MENPNNEVLPPSQPEQLSPQSVQLAPTKKWYADKAVMAMLILVILAASSLAAYFILNQPQNLGPVVVSHHKASEQTSNNKAELTGTTPPANSIATASPVVVSTSSPPTTDVNNCATSANQAPCYANQAKAQKNPAICKLASSQAFTDICYYYVATGTKNIQLCSQIQTQNKKDGCYLSFAATNNDAKLCSMIVTQAVHQQCLALFQPTVDTTPVSTWLSMDLDSTILTGTPGESVEITGQMQNTATNTLYLNGMTGSVVSVLNDPSNKGADLTLDPTDFFSLVPPSFQPGQSYQGPIFSVQISNNAKPGTYIFGYTLQGGKTEKDNEQLRSEEISIQVK